MADLMRARHKDTAAVADVPDNDYYRDLGWSKVSDDTPTDTEAARQAEGEAFHAAQVDSGVVFDPGAHTVDEVHAYLADVDDAERERVLAAEADGKGRVTILEA